ncbi:hypothetical protein GJ496_005360 [Pomphorhynchus laevis]|nr:hypothetical protein GJ496_005360 [Pomphorhynchus laevis]
MMEDAESNLVKLLWHKADRAALLTYADCINFCCDDSSVHRCWHVIRDELLEVSNKFASKIVIKKCYNRKPVWFDHNLKKALYE